MRIAASAVLVVAAAACARVPSAAGPPVADTAYVANTAVAGDFGDTLFVAGETITWDVRWVDVLMGGMSLAAGYPGEVDGRPTIIVRVEAHTAGVLAKLKQAYSELATMIDLETGVPSHVAGNIDDLYSGDIMHTDYEQKHVNLDWQPWDGETYSGDPITETVGALGWLRGWRPTEGDETHFLARVRGMLFRMDVVARGDEAVWQLGASVPVVRIDGILTRLTYDMQPDLTDTYPFIVWLSDDERRIPVRIHVQNQWGGIVELELTYSRSADLEIGG